MQQLYHKFHYCIMMFLQGFFVLFFFLHVFFMVITEVLFDGGILDYMTLKVFPNILIKVAKLVLNHYVLPNSVTKWEIGGH